jgi:hypothetical protein
MIHHISFLEPMAPESAADRNAVTEPSKSYAPPVKKRYPGNSKREGNLAYFNIR